jgi:hypothetical protein
MKKCLKCDTEKEKSEFGSDSYKSDGLNPYCKSCIRIRSCRQRMDNSEYFKNYAKEYRDKNKELLRRKQSVNYYLNWEKRAGVLKRKENCEECGKLCKTEGHHEDYFKPMEVSWLCKICHAKKHQIYR